MALVPFPVPLDPVSDGVEPSAPARPASVVADGRIRTTTNRPKGGCRSWSISTSSGNASSLASSPSLVGFLIAFAFIDHIWTSSCAADGRHPRRQAHLHGAGEAFLLYMKMAALAGLLSRRRS